MNIVTENGLRMFYISQAEVKYLPTTQFVYLGKMLPKPEKGERAITKENDVYTFNGKEWVGKETVKETVEKPKTTRKTPTKKV